MPTAFLRELDQLRKDLLTMGGLVEEATRKAVTALLQRRSELIMEVINGDKRIDAIENDIDAECHRVLALHQPVVADLRLVITVMKVNNELERMGDHAKNIARCADVLCRCPIAPIEAELEDMSARALDMVKQALDATVRSDLALATTVRVADKAVDAAYERIFAETQEMMKGGGDLIPAGVNIISAARNLERIADLATNIAKDVIFLVSGDQVRHKGASGASGASGG